MLATIPAHLIHDLVGAASMMKLARHLPHWMFYPACAIAAFIVVSTVGSAILEWTEKRDKDRNNAAG